MSTSTGTPSKEYSETVKSLMRDALLLRDKMVESGFTREDFAKMLLYEKDRKCDGMCSLRGECSGEVHEYTITGQKDLLGTFVGLKMNYCETAFNKDTSNGFTLHKSEGNCNDLS